MSFQEKPPPPFTASKLTREERETHLYFNQVEGLWRAWTEIPAHARKLKRLGWTYDDSSREWTGTGSSITLRSLRVRKQQAVRSSEQIRAALALGERSRRRPK